jgi:hypothetical protein
MHQYKVEGHGRETKRRRCREYEAHDEAAARKMAEGEGTAVESVIDLGDVDTIRAQQAEEGTKRILERDFGAFGFDDAMWSRAKAEVIAQGRSGTNADDTAFAVHRLLLENFSSPEALMTIYGHIGAYLRDRGKDSRPVMREFFRQQILSWRTSEIVRGVRVTAAAGCCRHCRAQDGLEMSLEEALLDPPLPCAHCTTKLYGGDDEFPWCRCSLSEVLVD